MRGAWRQLSAVAVLAGGAVAAQAHPHGVVACSAEVRLEAGRLQGLRGELRLDAAHSQQVAALVNGADGAVDADKLARFGFGLKLQLGRLNWLFTLSADGAEQPLKAGEPVLAFEGGRLRIQVDFSAVDATPHRDWSLQCADPGYYWVASFQPASAPLPPVAALPTAAPDDVSAVRIDGCGTAMRRTASERPGTGRIDWGCAPGS